MLISSLFPIIHAGVTRTQPGDRRERSPDLVGHEHTPFMPHNL